MIADLKARMYSNLFGSQMRKLSRGEVKSKVTRLLPGRTKMEMLAVGISLFIRTQLN